MLMRLHACSMPATVDVPGVHRHRAVTKVVWDPYY